MWEALLDWLFPPSCPGCGRSGGSRFCPDCAARLRPCGLTLPEGHQDRAGGLYEGPLRRAILRLKHAGLTVTVPALAEVMHSALEGSPPGVLVPIPAAPDRRRWRGLHGPGLLARRLAARLGGSCRPDLLVPARHLPSQKDLSREERLANVHGGFRAGSAAGAEILLVDDVLTTGATLAEAARVLRLAGARRVEAVVVAAVRGAWSASAPRGEEPRGQ